jgi:hypothetical protein
MSIVVLPDDIEISEVSCVICGSVIELAEATAGSVDGTGTQSFTCDRHFAVAESAQYLRGWIIFATEQAGIRGS